MEFTVVLAMATSEEYNKYLGVLSSNTSQVLEQWEKQIFWSGLYLLTALSVQIQWQKNWPSPWKQFGSLREVEFVPT